MLSAQHTQKVRQSQLDILLNKLERQWKSSTQLLNTWVSVKASLNETRVTTRILQPALPHRIRYTIRVSYGYQKVTLPRYIGGGDMTVLLPVFSVYLGIYLGGCGLKSTCT